MKRYIVQTRAQSRWVRPRLRQFVDRARCRVRGHVWGPWRIETEDWFEYVDAPVPYAWRACRRGQCGALEHVTGPNWTPPPDSGLSRVRSRLLRRQS